MPSPCDHDCCRNAYLDRFWLFALMRPSLQSIRCTPVFISTTVAVLQPSTPHLAGNPRAFLRLAGTHIRYLRTTLCASTVYFQPAVLECCSQKSPSATSFLSQSAQSGCLSVLHSRFMLVSATTDHIGAAGAGKRSIPSALPTLSEPCCGPGACVAAVQLMLKSPHPDSRS